MKLIIAIPSRYGSKRFEGKPLALIKNKPLIELVYLRAKKVKDKLKNSLENVDIVIATDDERIKEKCLSFDAKVIMTDSNLPSGTDRIYHATKDMEYDYIVNLQGDEPLIFEGDLIRLIEETIKHKYPCATLVYKAKENVENTDVVKVVIDKEKRALYFSRSKIPFGRDSEPEFYLKHIGVYIYKREILEKFVSLGESYLEKIEKLEQLRLLENGIPIYCIFAEKDTISVDRKEDIPLIEKYL
ncbi:MAG: 3-deoxy-manno-octulosonate cytidylyltransferase [Candidatus Hydrothermales bacterium]